MSNREDIEMETGSDSPDPQYPRRPPRLFRLFDEVSPFYFVTFNAHRRAPILARDEVPRAFVDFCQRAASIHVLVGGYVVMPDHIQLLVAMPEYTGPTLGAWIKSLKAVLGKTLLALGVEKPHWQEGFFDHVIRSSENHQDKWDYILQNPVRAGLCQRTQDWLYQGKIVAL